MGVRANVLTFHGLAGCGILYSRELAGCWLAAAWPARTHGGRGCSVGRVRRRLRNGGRTRQTRTAYGEPEARTACHIVLLLEWTTCVHTATSSFVRILRPKVDIFGNRTDAPEKEVVVIYPCTIGASSLGMSWPCRSCRWMS